MKKIFIATLLAASVLTSCNMDEEQFGVISTENAISNKNDCVSFLNGIYGNLRGCTAGSYIAAPDLQMDMFQATIINGNRNGQWAFGTILTGDQDVTGMYSSMYIRINACNYFLPRAQALIDGGTLSERDEAEIKVMIGQAKFARAFYNWYLFDEFCEAYTTENAEKPALGIQIVTDYHPTADRGNYPGRSTLAETVKIINDDLKDAYTALKEYEDAGNQQYCEPGAYRLSSYTVAALQARMALLTGDDKTAIEKAESVIKSGIYALCEIDDYADMWKYDQSTELLFVPFGNKTEGGPATGNIWLAGAQGQTSDFIPSSEAVINYLIDGKTDVRFRTFIAVHKLVVDGNEVQSPVFVKFPGNPDLFTSSNNLQNKPKPFRLSELYLIAAEAADRSNDPTKANKYLNDLREKRIVDYERVTLQGVNLTDAIRNERVKELIGEGFRKSDLKRWGLGFTRTCDYAQLGLDGLESILYPNSRNLSYQSTDYRFLWPIPQDEMTVNPQLNGQQNPGYNNN